jgi:hypothetical protein
MTVSARVQRTQSLGGLAFSENRTLTNEGAVIKEVSVPAAKTGSLTTRTDDNTGELTMAASHGIVTGDRIAIFWTEAGVPGCRRGVTVGTVAVNAVPIDGGTGDNLPTDETAITACVEVEEAFNLDGDAYNAIMMYGAAQGSISLCGADDVEDFGWHFPLGSQNYTWYENSGVANPIIGDVITKVFFANGSSAAAKTFRLAALVD